MPLTCLVIGGGGFIGRWLTERLINSGRQVVVLGRRAESPPGLHAQALYVAGDYGNASLAARLLEGADEVVDLAYATVPKSSFEDPLFDLNNNLQPAVTLLQAAAARTRISKVVLVSSGGTVYGHANATPIPENHATNPVSPYGITKLAIEKYGLMFHRLYGLPVVIVRPGNAYGEGQLPFRGQGFIATAIASLQQGRPLTVFGGESIVRDYVHVDDLSAGIVAALDAGQPGTCYNVGAGVGHSTDAVLAMVAALALAQGFEADVQRRPARAFDVKVNVLDCALLQAHTGWVARVPLNEGIGRAWRWLLQAVPAAASHRNLPTNHP